MENLLDKKQLENLLLRNWTSFINKNKLIVFVLQQIKVSKFEYIKTEIHHKKQLQITLSQMAFTNNGISIWADFSIPQEDSISIGTITMTIDHSGSIFLNQVLGNNFVN